MPDLFKFIAFGAAVLISQSSYACSCAPKSDATLYYENQNIQEATVLQIDRNPDSWVITLGDIKRWKGADSLTKVVAPKQSTSCSISISEGDRWVFFFNKPDKKKLYELDACAPARNSAVQPFSLEALFQHAVFDSKSLPDSVYHIHSLKIKAAMDQHFLDLKLDSLSDTVAGIQFTLNAQGIIENYAIDDAFLLSELDALSAVGGALSQDRFPVQNHPKLEAFIQALRGITYPVLHHYGQDLKVTVSYTYPVKRLPRN